MTIRKTASGQVTGVEGQITRQASLDPGWDTEDEQALGKENGNPPEIADEDTALD